jgi:deoxyribose-phosphate aldolase
MTDPNTYEIADLDATVDGVRKKFRDKLIADPDFFGHDKGVAERIALTLSEDAPKGTAKVPASVDANSTAGIMATVDLTLLDRNAKTEEVEKIARRAAKEHCATVCVYPEHVNIVSRIMKEEGVTDVPPIAVVGFPSVPSPSAEHTAATVKQTEDAIAKGAVEIDMVLPMSFREDKGDYQAHFRYIRDVIKTAHSQNIPVKVILETGYLTDRQIAKACVISKIAGADWVKTATGFAEEANLAKGKTITQHKGATPHDVALMRRAVGDDTLDDEGNKIPIGVKASGGVRNRAQAQAVLNAGADRIGASGGLDVRSEAEKFGDNRESSEQLKAAGGRY